MTIRTKFSHYLLPYLPRIALGLAAVSSVIGWWWKSRFIWGEGKGPYWLFIAVDWSILPLVMVEFLAFLGVTAAWLVQRARRKSKVRSMALASGVLLLAILVSLPASFTALTSPIEPMDRLRVNGHVYYLAGIEALIDVNYGLFECDRFGLICKEVYRSGDYSPERLRGRLRHDRTKDVIVVEVEGHGTIYTYPLEQRE